jgi:hypothetical protein
LLSFQTSDLFQPCPDFSATSSLWAPSWPLDNTVAFDPSLLPAQDPLDWSCAALNPSLDFDFSTLSHTTAAELDHQLSLALTPSPPSTLVDGFDSDQSAAGLSPLAGMPSALPLTPSSLSPTLPSTPALVPGLTSKPSLKRTASPDSPDDVDLLVKRHRNNIAAKKYRQKKVDRIKELEDEVADIKREREELRIRLARQEAESAALREMLAGKLDRRSN